MSISQSKNQRFNLIGLSTLLHVFFISVAVIPVLFLGTWVQRNALQAEEQLVQDKHLLLAKNLSGSLSRYILDLKAIFGAHSNFSSKPFSHNTRELLQVFHIQVMILVDGDSLIFGLGSDSLLPKQGMSALQIEKGKAFENPDDVVFSPVLMNRKGEAMLYLLTVNNADQLVVGAISTDYIQQVQSEISFGNLGHAAIVDHSGQVIAHPMDDWEREAKNISKLKPVQAMLAGKTGVSKFYSPALKADMIAGFTALPETGWGVMIPQPYSEIEAQAWNSRLAAWAISGVGLLLALLLSWKLTAYILIPIQSIIAASRRLAAGDEIEKVPIERKILPREIHNLLQSFEDMAKEVSSVRVNLEKRVQERTHELVAEVEVRKLLEKRLVQQATHDSLTGLPNRTLLTQRLEKCIAYAQRNETCFALLFIDLDGFKQVNDTYGHRIGDALLVSVSQRFLGCLRLYDSVYRLGGDEFVIMIEKLDPPETAQLIANKIIDEVNTEFVIESHHIIISGSIGIKIVNDQSSATVDKILSDADQAMYQAKKKGNCSVLY